MEASSYIISFIAGFFIGGITGYLRGSHIGINKSFRNLSAHFRIRGK